jgi:tetratricopeptide (TPR) repeat protein
MVEALGGARLPADTRDALVERADGVPLYIEELTKAVVEPGAGRGVEAIPETLADSLIARLDRLSAAKEVAQRAAVLGREFSYALLAATAGIEQVALQQGLERLIEAEILFARGAPPSATYTFKHALVHEAAYASLLKRTRHELHARVVHALLQRLPGEGEPEPEVLARHAEAAGSVDQAITYYQRAGEIAQTRSAHEEASNHLRKAIALLVTLPAGRRRDEREVAAQLALGKSVTAIRGFAHRETQTVIERAHALCERMDDRSLLPLTLLGLGVFHLNHGDIERSRSLALQVLAAGTRSERLADDLLAHAIVGSCEYYMGRFTSALAHLENAIALRDRVLAGGHSSRGIVVDAISATATASSWVGWCLWMLGFPAQAVSACREGVERARSLGEPFVLAHALLFEALVHWVRADHGAQRRCAAQVVELGEAHGFPLWAGAGKAGVAAARVFAGDRAAVADVVDGLAIAAQTDNQGGASAFFALLADVQRSTGALTEALATIDMGLTFAAQTKQAFFDAELLRSKGQLLIEMGCGVDASEALFRQALAVARAQEARSFELRAATSLGRLLVDRGRHREARALLAPLYGWFTEGHETPDLVATKALLDELAPA